jgi:hypothetical protein
MGDNYDSFKESTNRGPESEPKKSTVPNKPHIL